MERSEARKTKTNFDPNETNTSDFYQIPVQGGIPMQFTVESGRRPFTPPFSQLVKLGKPSTSGQSARRVGVPPPQKVPDFVNSASSHHGVGLLSNDQKNELKKEIQLINEEQPIEEEIEGANGADSSPFNSKKSKQGSGLTATQDSTSEPSSKDKAGRATPPDHAAPVVDFSDSMKRCDAKNMDLLVDQSGSNTHTFGRRSRIDGEPDDAGAEPIYVNEDEFADDIDRAPASSKHQKATKVDSGDY